jgi:AcrR family transcriptional regulator
VARPSLRPDEIESFRERLCDAAMETFAEQGYEAVTLRGLAEKLGCSHATPYRYFADKREIFAAVCALGFDRFADALERAARGVADPEERLRAIGRAYFKFAMSQPHAYRIMFELREPVGAPHPHYKIKELRSWQVLRPSSWPCSRACSSDPTSSRTNAGGPRLVPASPGRAESPPARFEPST